MPTIVMMMLKQVATLEFLLLPHYLALFGEELVRIAQDEMFNEFCEQLRTKFMKNWIDQEFIPEIARECHEEVTSDLEEELDRRDRLAIESLRISIFDRFTPHQERYGNTFLLNYLSCI
jgi:hypothetical protein